MKVFKGFSEKNKGFEGLTIKIKVLKGFRLKACIWLCLDVKPTVQTETDHVFLLCTFMIKKWIILMQVQFTFTCTPSSARIG